MKTESEGDFYFHNPKWPVWSRSSEGIPCEQLITLILSDAFTHPEKIYKSRPVGVRHNAVFVIDLNCVSLKNLTADDNGSWDICSPRRMYQIEKSDSNRNILSIKRANTTGSGVYTLFRQYGTHKATKKEKGVDFKRVIATVKDPKGTILPAAILHYFFKSGEEEDIVLAPHGNARESCKRPYVRTAPSTLSSIKKECLHKKPKRLYGEKFSSTGGLLESDSASSEPRNPKQVYNA